MTKQNLPISSLDTPAVLVNMETLEANIREMSQLAAEAGVKLRPHTKIHESSAIAKLQIKSGACGIEVGTIDRAVCMAEAGINDILVAHPFYGDHKLETLRTLLNKPGLKISLLVDMIEQASAISRVGEEFGKKIPVLLKINTGGNRFGVLPGDPALNLARKLRQFPGIEFIGIYAHESGGKPTQESLDKLAFETATMMTETASLLKKEGIPVEHMSVGASPTFRATCQFIKEQKFPEITEIHPGHSVIGDVWHVIALGNKREACAATVLTTVMSTPAPGYVVVDAGYKTFGADALIQYRDNPAFFWKGRPSYGSVQGRSDMWLGRLAAESACVYYMEPNMDPKKELRIGDQLQIVPNNATLVINMEREIYGVRNGVVERVFSVAGRE
jgi:D-serine deaminase-like pyridoxal phosphate-dependent protein